MIKFKQIILLVFILIGFAGCDLVKHKQSLLLECVEGKVIINWYRADMVSNDLDIKQPKYLAKSGFYKDAKGNYMKCVKE